MTHGLSYTPTWLRWTYMIARCRFETATGYKNYGGRGIRVCNRWKKSFLNFLKDMGPLPSKNHSINRIDNNGDYTPKNCEWTTRKYQARNARSNRNYLHKGAMKPLTQIAQEENVKYAALRWRMQRGKKKYTLNEALKGIKNG